MHMSWHSANYWLAVDQVSIECQPSIDKDVNRIPMKVSIKGINWRYWSTLGSGCLWYTWSGHKTKQLLSSIIHVSIGGRQIALYFETNWQFSCTVHAWFTIKYARTLISMVFFCNWCSAADSSFFSSSTISSSLFFDSLCSCDNNEYAILDSLFWLHRKKPHLIDKFCSTNTCSFTGRDQCPHVRSW